MRKPFIIGLALALTLAVGLSAYLASCTDLQNPEADDAADELLEEGSDTSIAGADSGPDAGDSGEADDSDHAADDGHDAAEPMDDAEEVDDPGTADDAEDVPGADDDEEEPFEYVADRSLKRYEDNTTYISREGGWQTDRSAQASGGTMTRPTEGGGDSTMEITFKGTRFRLLCGRDNAIGKIYIRLSGIEAYIYQTLDITTPSTRYQEVVWDTEDLPQDLYTVKIWMDSKGVWIDAVDIWGDAVR